MDLEIQVPKERKFIFPLNRHMVDFEADLFLLLIMLGTAQHLQVMADHQSGQIRHLNLRLADGSADLSVSHDHDAVRDLHDLSHLVRDEENGIALRDKAADEFHQCVDLLGHQDRSRLIHDQNARIPVERLHDLYLLLHADRKIPDLCLRADTEMIAVGQFLDLLLLGSVIDPALHISKNDVFRNCMCPDE